MLKVADALHEEGYRVRAVTHERAGWAAAYDGELERERPWLDRTRVDTRREAGAFAFWPAAARYHGSRRLSRTLGIARAGATLRRRAWLRSSEELLDAAISEPTDFLYFCGGSFPIAREAARRLGARYAIDFEDFHSGELDDTREGRWQAELTMSLERDAFEDARFVTMGSPLIASRYRERDGVDGTVIHNVFPLPAKAPAFELPRGPLKLYWFSQTIGPGRGLEVAICAVGLSTIRAELHLRGAISQAYRAGLETLARDRAPNLSLEIHEPSSPAAMVESCRAFDVGLALETGADVNKRILLSNKIFTYLLAGLAIAFSETDAQRSFRNALGDRQALFALGDAKALAAWLARWDENRSSLLEAKKDAWSWAKRRWHWEHEDERGAVIRCFRKHLAHPRRPAEEDTSRLDPVVALRHE